jgi:hypothetical protein
MIALHAVTRALSAIKRYDAPPERIDHVILAAINVGLCLASGGSDSVAEAFNNDVLTNGRGFPRPPLMAAAAP